MARGSELLDTTKAQIISLKDAGLSYAAIARQLCVHAETARQVYLRWEEYRCISSRPRSGRPKAFDKHDLRRLKVHITRNRETRRQALGEIIVDQNLPVSTKTLGRYITKDLGLHRCIERRKPFLTEKQKAARLAFAKAHIHWGPEEWHRVIWTDEMSMQTDANIGRIWVWRYPEEEFLEDCMRGTVISGFQKIKIWGGIRYGKLSKLVVLPEGGGDGKMNAQEYCDIIMDGEMYDFWEQSSEELGYVLVMEDGAPYHMGCATTRRKELQEVGWLGWGPGTWPSSSPDLNPIENLWHILRMNVRKRRVQPRNKQALIEALQEEWEKLDIEMVNYYCDSMPRRLQAVIKAKGGSTKY
jgi:transposase